MSDLKVNKFDVSKPFLYSDVDYFGPSNKMESGKNESTWGFLISLHEPFILKPLTC